TYNALNLALEFLAGTDLDKADTLFRNTYLLNLFQLGHSLVKKLQTRAKNISIGQIYPFLDYPELLFIDSLQLTQLTPSQKAAGNEEDNLQPITSIKDLERVEQRLKQIESLQDLFINKLPFKLPNIETETEEYPSLSGLFLTAVANQLLGKDFTPTPLTVIDMPVLKNKTFEDDQISADFRRDIHESMQQLAPGCNFFIQFCLEIWTQIFQNLDSLTNESPFIDVLLLADQ
ncbi:MAG: DUF6178 family protein, partial [Thermodesulfobacteriota bacterium]|nr:DUF6178 family protein [Thermodesulfobacteriota bacterium]